MLTGLCVAALACAGLPWLLYRRNVTLYVPPEPLTPPSPGSAGEGG